MSYPEPHAYRCECEDCRTMHALLGATDSLGNYVFTNKELEQMALQNAEHRCDCEHCEQLRKEAR